MSERILRKILTELEEIKREIADLRSELDLQVGPPSAIQTNSPPSEPAQDAPRAVTSRDW